MKKNLHDIDKLFKAALDDQEENPPAGAWDAIDQQLDKNKVVDINRKYIQLKRVAVALLVLLLGVAAYTLTTINKSEKFAKENKTNITIPGENSNGQIKSENNREEKEQTVNNQPGELREPALTGSIPAEIPTGKTREDTTTENAGNKASNNKSSTNATVAKNNADINNSRKISNKKGNQKTAVIQADFDEAAEVSYTTSNIAESPSTANLSPLAGINPETIKGEPDNTFKNILADKGYPLNNGITIGSMGVKEITSPHTSPFTLTAFYAPGISDNHIKAEEHERRPGGPVNNREKEKIRDGEQQQTSATVGLLLDYKMSKHWSLQSGLTFLNKSIQIEPKTIYAHADNNGDVKYLYDCSSGYLFLTSKSVSNPALGDSINALASNNTLQYVAIPLGIRYSYAFKKIELSTSMGATVNFLTKGKIETEISNGSGKEVSINNKINGLKSGYFSGNIGLGIAYNFTERVAFSFMPYYNFALTSSTKNAAVKSYPNSMNLAAGIRYRL